MKKIILTFILAIIFCVSAEAKALKNDFSNVIQEFGADIESIAVSIKNADNGKEIYSLNDKMLMNPASVQKILTTPVAYEILGKEYNFKTTLYSRGENCYLLKLGADPYLSANDLKTLVKKINPQIQQLFIDDTILDNKVWGEGWQWDDDLNTLMPKFGAYNLDKNLIKLTIMPGENGQFATIINPSKYPLVFFNHITTDKRTQIKINRDNNISTNTLILTGTIARPTTIYIPVNNLQRYFYVQLSKLLEDRNIYLKQNFAPNKMLESDLLCDEISHSIENAIIDVLKNSNNMISETMFKLAGAKYLNIETGTDLAGIKMFNDYCKNNNIDNTRIKIADASGVSKNNLVSADFITEFLYKNKNNKAYENLPKPGEGTLTHRMLPIKNNLKAKTGTLSDLSAIAGFLTTKKGKNYVFSIMINDTKLSASDKKMLEDFIIREAYLRL